VITYLFLYFFHSNIAARTTITIIAIFRDRSSITTFADTAPNLNAARRIVQMNKRIIKEIASI
jgi:hypothetical protein